MKSNFIKRTLTGVLFVAVLAGAIVFGPYSFALLFAIVTALSVREFVHLANNISGVCINPLINMLGGIYLYFAFLSFCGEISGPAVFIPYLFILIYLMISELYLKKKDPLNAWAYSMLSQTYVALPFALLNVLAFQNNSGQGAVTYNYVLPLAIFIFIWINDTGAYCIGSLIGKHRLFERISPKKSWEGSIGGGVFAIITAFLLWYFLPFMMSLFEWIGLALVVVLFGTWGDLAESLVKRHLGIKDSGNILPGHGGILDRFDSALIAIPAAVVYIYLITMP